MSQLSVVATPNTTQATTTAQTAALDVKFVRWESAILACQLLLKAEPRVPVTQTPLFSSITPLLTSA